MLPIPVERMADSFDVVDLLVLIRKESATKRAIFYLQELKNCGLCVKYSILKVKSLTDKGKINYILI